jgi:hypothetical protein
MKFHFEMGGQSRIKVDLSADFGIVLLTDRSENGSIAFAFRVLWLFLSESMITHRILDPVSPCVRAFGSVRPADESSNVKGKDNPSQSLPIYSVPKG